MEKRIKLNNDEKEEKEEEKKKKGIVFSLFDLSGVLVKPWAEAGYECHIVDLQHPEKMTIEGNITKWGMDVFEWEKIF